MLTRFSSVLVVATLATVALAAVASADVFCARVVKLSPSVIHEPFSVLPCPGVSKNGSTLEEEDRAEHQILGTDEKIDALNRAIFAKLRGTRSWRLLWSANRSADHGASAPRDGAQR